MQQRDADERRGVVADNRSASDADERRGVIADLRSASGSSLRSCIGAYGQYTAPVVYAHQNSAQT